MRSLGTALFWGSLWGAWEATAGHLFHLARIPGAAGIVMFPIGFLIMARAFAATGKQSSIVWTAGVAAAIKLADLLLPGTDFFMVINPAQAILLESIAVVAIFSFSNSAKRSSPAVPILASVSWRLAYAFVSLFAAGSYSAANFFQAGILSPFRFLIVEAVCDGLLVYVILQIIEMIRFAPRRPVYE